VFIKCGVFGGCQQLQQLIALFQAEHYGHFYNGFTAARTVDNQYMKIFSLHIKRHKHIFRQDDIFINDKATEVVTLIENIRSARR
jgi:GTP-sensing pleiotropic transcriptional regulator CodY